GVGEADLHARFHQRAHQGLGSVHGVSEVNLNPAVGHGRAGCHRVGRPGANRSNGLCQCEDLQRRLRARGRLDRPCSVLTRKVNVRQYRKSFQNKDL
ncbi:MAG: hypothetical protein AB1670_23705, partial [Pseudomonadota bacterium]